jgi:cytosine/adenosine deaminase-related metal-dependent hydrolase
VRLTGARVALTVERSRRLDVSVRNGRIESFGSSTPHLFEFDLSGHLLLPGLINSHDHLEFNLYPRLAAGPHPNYIAWAAAVYRPDSALMKRQLAIAKAIRLVWGGLKNLISGVTTVAHHNPYEPKVFNVAFPVRVVRRYGWGHSTHFSPDLPKRYSDTPRKWPFLVHAAEGTCANAAAEIHTLDKAGLLADRTVLIHGVALDPTGARMLRRRQVSLVWCPSSNLFTLGQTMRSDVLRSGLTVALGTDSALTGEGDLIDELRVARTLGEATPKRLFEMVTTTAARVLRLSHGEGQISEGGVADLVAVADRGGKPSDALQEMNPELVILGGKIKLLSRRLAERLPRRRKIGLEPVSIEGRGDYLVDANIAELYASVASELGDSFRLAGKRVSL